MSKKICRIILLGLLAVFCLMLFACKASVRSKTYTLNALLVDRVAQPEAIGVLTLAEDGTGTLELNGEKASLSWTKEPFEVRVSNLNGTCCAQNDGIVMSLPEIGMELYFDTAVPDQSSDLQTAVTGPEFEGRLYFSSCEGEWEEYENRTMAVNAVVTGEKLVLTNSAYSPDEPMGVFHLKEGKAEGGYLMAYPLGTYDVRTTVSTERRSEVNNTEFILSEEYIWNRYLEMEREPTEDELVEVTTYHGMVRNADGGYTFDIVLTPKTPG